MGSITLVDNYKKLYDLQDKVLDMVFVEENIFYLTGGTCLSRFYHEKRYSDDLDFFSTNEPRFKMGIKNIMVALKKQFIVKEDITSKDFVRIIIDDLLQVDFINDRVYRYDKAIVTSNNYLIDNIHNILSNKLNAVIDRDEKKDIFDIYLICKYYSFEWKDILEISHKKAEFNNEDLIIRLKTFPIVLMEKINVIDKNFLENFENDFLLIIEEINYKTKHIAIDNHD